MAQHRYRAAGFTLIELMVVIVLLGLLAASAAMMVRLPLEQARLQQSISQLRVLDALARERAKQGATIQLLLDLQENSARLVDHRGQEVAPAMRLMGGNQFIGLLGLEKRSETLRWIAYDRFGTSSSFAVRIGSGAEQEREQWLLILGMTGQSYLTDDRVLIDEIIQTQRRHAA
ncbi:MAG: prepilin-type N-terminal cleavage/methylation domain-containing protein [Pirellulales bacterium]|nr:prepilin-type N-terminal cleavage/methylation domain-containing protein [Pirellulales bacterium]